ncbi:MAG: hypothetical protein PUA90_04695 [bacterium]|nr:hypothetical protein [bacterium]
MKIIFIILIFILNINNIKAYENNYFSIDIPQDYILETEEDHSYKWIRENNYIAITISNNKELNYNISTYTKTDIENQRKYIENNINSKLEDFNIKVSVNNIKKIKLNNKDVLNYSIYWPTLDSTGYNTYQIGNVFTTNNYITTIVYSSDKEINDDSEYYNIINSVIIKDDNIKNNNIYSILIFIVMLVLIIVGYIRRHKTKKA